MNNTLQAKKEQLKRLYKRTRYIYPEIAQQAKRNIQAIDKQLKLIKKDK